MVRKTVFEIVSVAYNELKKLHPTPEEIQAYADFLERGHWAYGVVTSSKSRGGAGYFLDLHDTWKEKFGGRAHIDIGFTEEESERNVPDTLHLMLDKDHASDFISFIKKRRGIPE